MACDAGRLRAYLDDGLSPDDRAMVSAHLADCPACRGELAMLEERRQAAGALLAALETPRAAAPDVDVALAEFRRRQAVAGTAGLLAQLRGWEANMKQSFFGWRRPVLLIASVLAVALVLLSFAPVRQAAADFLGVFRVRKFAVIPIAPDQAQRIEDIVEATDGAMFGEKTVLREAGEPQSVASFEEAAAVAGFTPRTPTALPEGATLDRIEVQAGPAFRLEVQRDVLQGLIETAGLGDATLPDFDTATVEVDVPASIAQHYLLDEGKVSLVQLPSPAANLPEGLDPVAFAEIGLQFLGMPAEDARRLAESVDWTSTMVIPLPTDVGRSSEVTVDGVPGLLLEEMDGGDRYNRDAVILWEREGIMYAAQGRRLDPAELLQFADSLR